MPPPQRPTMIEILEAYETDVGHFECWAMVAGHELHFVFEPGAIANRKLIYGLAELVEQEDGSLELVDLIADADDRAIRHLFEEHLDRFEDASHDWREQTAPERASRAGHAMGHRRNYTRRRAMEKAVNGLAARGPEQRPPAVRRRERSPVDRPRPDGFGPPTEGGSDGPDH